MRTSWMKPPLQERQKMAESSATCQLPVQETGLESNPIDSRTRTWTNMVSQPVQETGLESIPIDLRTRTWTNMVSQQDIDLHRRFFRAPAPVVYYIVNGDCQNLKVQLRGDEN